MKYMVLMCHSGEGDSKSSHPVAIEPVIEVGEMAESECCRRLEEVVEKHTKWLNVLGIYGVDFCIETVDTLNQGMPF